MEAFIFDMDGVIIDSEPIHFEIDVKTMAHLGVNISPQELERFVGMTNPEMWKILKQEYNLQPSIAEIIEYQLTSKIELLRALEMSPIDGISDLILELKKHNIKLAIVSSSPRTFINEVLSKFQMNDYFDSVISGEEVERGKPMPDIYIESAKCLGVMTDQCYVLEDSKHGLQAAKSANMKCIGFINPNSGNQDLSMADQIVKSIREIKVTGLVKE